MHLDTQGFCLCKVFFNKEMAKVWHKHGQSAYKQNSSTNAPSHISPRSKAHRDSNRRQTSSSPDGLELSGNTDSSCSTSKGKKKKKKKKSKKDHKKEAPDKAKKGHRCPPTSRRSHHLPLDLDLSSSASQTAIINLDSVRPGAPQEGAIAVIMVQIHQLGTRLEPIMDSKQGVLK
jgi:hypothetical protein